MLRSFTNVLKNRMRFGPFTAKRARGHAFILMYHRVLPEEDCASANANHALNVSTHHFDAHLAYLKRWFDIVPLSQMIDEIAASRSKSDRPRLAITFDDGWRDNYEHAWPILKKHNLPATIFLVSDYVGTDKMLWWSALEAHYALRGSPPVIEWLRELQAIASDEYPEIARVLAEFRDASPLSPEDVIQKLKTAEYGALERFTQALAPAGAAKRTRELMDWNHIREMQDASIEFGAHTERHELLPLLDDASVQKTVRGSVETLQSHGLNVIDIFSYPNGDNNPRVQRAVADAGFKFAVGTGRGTISSTGSNLLDLPRINIGGGNDADVPLVKRRLARAFWLQR